MFKDDSIYDCFKSYAFNPLRWIFELEKKRIHRITTLEREKHNSFAYLDCDQFKPGSCFKNAKVFLILVEIIRFTRCLKPNNLNQFIEKMEHCKIPRKLLRLFEFKMYLSRFILFSINY